MSFAQKMIAAVTGVFFVPAYVFAAVGTRIGGTFQGYVVDVIALILYAGTGLAIVAILVFMWGLAKFVLAAGDEKAHEGGKRLMVWGTVAIAVMVSTTGLVLLLAEIFGVQGPFPLLGGNSLVSQNGLDTLSEIVLIDIIPLLNYVVVVLLGLAVLAFIVGIIRFIYALSRGDEKSLGTGKQLMIWGIIALTVMFSWWGIVNVLASALGIRSWNPADLSTIVPRLQFQ